MRPRTVVVACASLFLLLSCSGTHSNRSQTMEQWRTSDNASPSAKVDPTPPQTAKSHAKTKKRSHDAKTKKRGHDAKKKKRSHNVRFKVAPPRAGERRV